VTAVVVGRGPVPAYQGTEGCAAAGGEHHGRAVQVDPTKATLKACGTKRLKVKHITLLSNFAFKFKLRRYITDWFTQLLLALKHVHDRKAGADTRPLLSSTSSTCGH